jgi:hypothetical protein
MAFAGLEPDNLSGADCSGAIRPTNNSIYGIVLANTRHLAGEAFQMAV